MFASTVRENEIVRLPSGRLGMVQYQEAGVVTGLYLDTGEEWELRAQFLVHVAQGKPRARNDRR